MADDYVFDDPELRALEEQYGAGYVLTAFDVQQKIGNEGIRGIEFMDKSEDYLEGMMPLITYQKVGKEIRRSLKQNGI